MKQLWIRLVAALPLTNTAILIAHGRATVTRGKVRPALLSELGDLARSTHVETACILARTTATTFRLTFVSIPAHLQQRFRNVWGANWR